MATRSAAAPTARGTREGPAERLAEFVVLGGMAALAVGFVLPLAVTALPVWGALHAVRRRSWRVRTPALLLCALPAPAALLWAYLALGADPAAVATGYVEVQLDVTEAVVRAWPVADWTPLLLAYAGAVWPYAVVGGAALGALGNALHALRGGSLSDEKRRNEENDGLVFRDAGDMAAAPEREMSWAVYRVLGRGVVALLSAPPGLGKGWWTWAWLRAMQDGEDFFGLAVKRPYTTPSVVARWCGRKPRALKVLWLTEEGESFGETAKRFGITPGLVTVLQRQEVRTTEWPEIVRIVRREAFRRGCAYVIIDTIRAWCPQAEHSNTHAAEVMNLARKELVAAGLGVLFVHHDTKSGGEFGAGVAGPNNLVGSCDVLIELRRVKDDPTARRMLVSRRYGDQDVTARLVEHRYVVAEDTVAEDEAEEEREGEDAPPDGARVPPGHPGGAAEGGERGDDRGGGPGGDGGAWGHRPPAPDGPGGARARRAAGHRGEGRSAGVAGGRGAPRAGAPAHGRPGLPALPQLPGLGRQAGGDPRPGGRRVRGVQCPPATRGG